MFELAVDALLENLARLASTQFGEQFLVYMQTRYFVFAFVEKRTLILRLSLFTLYFADFASQQLVATDPLLRARSRRRTSGAACAITSPVNLTSIVVL